MRAGKWFGLILVLSLVVVGLWGDSAGTPKPRALSAVTTYPLHEAAAASDVELVRRLIAEGADVNAQGPSQRTPLHYAAIAGHREVAQVLLDSGADVEARDRWGDTPLHGAAEYAHLDVTELLLERGADANAKDDYGATPLHVVGWSCDGGIVELLLAHGADPMATDNDGWTPLHDAAYGCCTPSVEILLAHDVDVNAANKDGRTPLHYAASIGHKPIIRLLIASGADLNVSDEKGYTPAALASERNDRTVVELLLASGAEMTLHLAACLDDVEALDALLEAGAEVDATDASGRTALCIAAARGNVAALERLVAYGAEVDFVVDEGYARTPLLDAVSGGRIEVVRVLVDAGADVNYEGEFSSWTPLALAVMYGEAEIGQLLIAAGAKATIDQAAGVGDLDTVTGMLADGADVHARYGSGNLTLLQIAARRGFDEVVEFLAAQGVDIDAKTARRTLGPNVQGGEQTALHMAASAGHAQTVELLIACGATPDEPDALGHTPLHAASRYGYGDVVDVLLAHGCDINARTVQKSASGWPDRESGWTPLRYAAALDDMEMVEALFAHAAAANIDIVDLYGPLYQAVRYGHMAMIERLLSAGAVADQAVLDLAVENGFADVVTLLGGDADDPALADNGAYTIIVTDQANTRRFLRWEGVLFEETWIPTTADIEGLAQTLNQYLRDLADSGAETSIRPDYIRVYSRLYSRQYSGFTRDDRPYIICCMVLFGGFDDEPPDSFSLICDGGCSIVVVVFDAETGAVVHVSCHGMA